MKNKFLSKRARMRIIRPVMIGADIFGPGDMVEVGRMQEIALRATAAADLAPDFKAGKLHVVAKGAPVHLLDNDLAATKPKAWRPGMAFTRRARKGGTRIDADGSWLGQIRRP